MKINLTSALLHWITFKLYLPLHNYLKWWLWSITHSSWNIEVFLGCKDALDDPDGVYRNSDGLLVRVEPRSLTFAELLFSDSASPRLRLGVQPKSDSSAQLWLVDRLSYYKIVRWENFSCGFQCYQANGDDPNHVGFGDPWWGWD